MLRRLQWLAALLPLAGSGLAAAPEVPGLAHLRAVAVDLQARVDAGQVPQERACEVMQAAVAARRDVVDGAWRWRLAWEPESAIKSAPPPGTERLSIGLALRCPNRPVLRASRELSPAVQTRAQVDASQGLNARRDSPSSLGPPLAGVALFFTVFGLLGVVAATRRSRDRMAEESTGGGLHVPELPAAPTRLAALLEEREQLRVQLRAAGVWLDSRPTSPSHAG